MIPILYKANETDFNHRGLGSLKEVLDWKVTEVLNGEFELFAEYPVNGKLYESIEDSMMIKAKPNRKDDPHLFRIYEHEMDMETQTVLIYARSNVFDLAGNMVRNVNVNNLTPQQAMNAMKANLIEPTDFTFYSDITTTSSTVWTRRNALNCIAGEQGSLLQYWGGEIKRGNKWLWLYRRRGNDNVTTIRYGKDLAGLSAKYSIKGLVTAILPYYVDREGDTTITGNVVKSQYVNNYPVAHYEAVEFGNDDGVTDEASLNQVAARYFTDNPGIDLPSISMDVKLLDLSHTEEFKKFKDLEQVEIGDTLTVYAKKYKVNLTAKVTKVVYNGMTDENEELEIGTVRASTYDDYKELVDRTVAPIKEQVNIVQIAANGKNKVFRGVDEPETGMSLNDLWYKPVGDGETELYRFDGSMWLLEKVSAGLLGGTLDAENGDVDLINVNVNKIVGNTSEFVSSAWNGIGGLSVKIDGASLMSSNANGDFSRMTAGEFRSSNAASSATAVLGQGRAQFFSMGQSLFIAGRDIHSNKSGGVLGATFNTQFSIGRYDRYAASDDGTPQYNAYLELGYSGDESHRDQNGIIRANRAIYMGDTLHMEGSPIRNPSEITLANGGSITSLSSNSQMRLRASGQLQLGTSGSWGLLMDNSYMYSYRNISMEGYAITNQSDIRLKTKMDDATVDALKEIERMAFIDFEWDKTNPVNANKPDGRFFGIKAQYSPFLQTHTSKEESYLSIDMNKQVTLNSKAIQELWHKVKELTVNG